MSKYVKHRKSLDSKSKKARKSDETSSCSSSVESSAVPSVSGGSHSDSWVLTEARVLELISSSFSQLSESLSALMDFSFANMETMINDRMSYVSQDVPNRSFSALSPVPVRQSPCQGRKDPSLESPRTGYGNPEGRPEEPVQVESAVPSFLSSLREAGIELPQDIHLLDG